MGRSFNTWERMVLKAVRDAGWEVREGNKHPVLIPPDGARPIPLTRRTRHRGRGQANMRATLRRYGIEVGVC